MVRFQVHRTQVYLEDAQYEMLRGRARREGKSLAAVIREILDEHLGGSGSRGTNDRFSDVVGIGEGDGSRVAENYEEYLYGEDS
jgi:predicted DNA-binding ribbon-helix-helix protein